MIIYFFFIQQSYKKTLKFYSKCNAYLVFQPSTLVWKNILIFRFGWISGIVFPQLWKSFVLNTIAQAVTAYKVSSSGQTIIKSSVIRLLIVGNQLQIDLLRELFQSNYIFYANFRPMFIKVFLKSIENIQMQNKFNWTSC